jgi:hypothetical protein
MAVSRDYSAPIIPTLVPRKRGMESLDGQVHV